MIVSVRFRHRDKVFSNLWTSFSQSCSGLLPYLAPRMTTGSVVHVMGTGPVDRPACRPKYKPTVLASFSLLPLARS